MDTAKPPQVWGFDHSSPRVSFYKIQEQEETQKSPFEWVSISPFFQGHLQQLPKRNQFNSVRLPSFSEFINFGIINKNNIVVVIVNKNIDYEEFNLQGYVADED